VGRPQENEQGQFCYRMGELTRRSFMTACKRVLSSLTLSFILQIIFLVNFIWEFFVLQNLPKEIQPMVPGLLVVFMLGIVLSTFEFMFAFIHKAKDPSIRGGDVCCSSAVRSEKHDNQ
jgi:hypothetical protein